MKKLTPLEAMVLVATTMSMGARTGRFSGTSPNESSKPRQDTDEWLEKSIPVESVIVGGHLDCKANEVIQMERAVSLTNHVSCPACDTGMPAKLSRQIGTKLIHDPHGMSVEVPVFSPGRDDMPATSMGKSTDLGREFSNQIDNARRSLFDDSREKKRQANRRRLRKFLKPLSLGKGK